MAPVAGQPHDCKCDEKARHQQHGERPPPGHLVETDTFRQLHVDPMLQKMREFEERPRSAGHHEPDNSGSDEEAPITPAAHQGDRVSLTGLCTSC